MKNRFRTVALAALFAAALVGGCCNDCKKPEMMDDKNAMMNDKGMMKHCAKCGMACDAKGMCPHCDAGKMMK